MHMHSGTTCLVIGGRGFIGAAVAAEAGARGLRVDVAERDDYDRMVGTRYDIVVNANGNSKKYLAQQQPALDFDLSVRSVMRALADFPAGLYVQLSSMDVYPDKSDPACNHEGEPIDGARLSPYGFHKFLAESLVRRYAANWLIFRLAGFVGPGLKKNSVFDLLRGKPLFVHPDSRYQYLHTRDLARILFDLMALDLGLEIINVAAEGTVSIREMAAWAGRNLEGDAEERPRECCELSVERLKRLLDIPGTGATVREFISAVREGREKIG